MSDRARAADLVRRAMDAALRARPVRFVRSRRPLVAATASAALAVALVGGAPPAADEASIAAMLADAAGGEVAPADVVWEPSRGAAMDLVWGRGVAFLASTPTDERAASRDVLRARVSVSPDGRPLRVRAVTEVTTTPLADEHDLLARDGRLAWATRGAGGEHGVTVLIPADRTRADALVDAVIGAGLPTHEVVHAVLASPATELRAELRDDGLVLALRAEEGTAAALVDPVARVARADATAPRIAVVVAPGPTSWIDTILAASVPPAGEAPPPSGVVLAADEAFPPSGPAWEPLVAGAVPVPGPAPPPAPVVRAVLADGPHRVVVHAIDLRQLAVRVVPAPSAPVARSGLPGSGSLRAEDAERAVAAIPTIPLHDGGAREEGREVAPFGVGVAIASDAAGTVTLGPLPEGARSAIELVEGGEPRVDDAAAGAICTVGGATMLHAAERRGDREAIRRALGALGCEGPVWIADPPGGAAPWVGDVGSAPRPRPFAAFLRRRSFPEGRAETWTASRGRQPAPTFRPGVLETQIEVLGTPVRIVALAAGRFGWAIRAGTGERSHRMGGVFPESLGPLRPRVVAALGLGIGERRRPNGLTIDGSTGHRYASRGAVLIAGADELRLLRSSDVRGDPAGDATELPLTAEAGELTAAARERGLLHERADLCILPDGTVLVAVARFDSHEAGTEALLRLGCGDVAALDRGLDLPAVVVRPDAELAEDTFGGTTLLALEPGR